MLKKALITGLIHTWLAPTALATTPSDCADQLAKFYQLRSNEEKVLEGLNDDGKACSVKLRYLKDDNESVFFATMDSEIDEYGSVYISASVAPTSEFERTSLSSCKASVDQVSFRSRAKELYGWHKKFSYTFKASLKRIEMKERVTGFWVTNNTDKAHCNFN